MRSEATTIVSRLPCYHTLIKAANRERMALGCNSDTARTRWRGVHTIHCVPDPDLKNVWVHLSECVCVCACACVASTHRRHYKDNDNKEIHDRDYRTKMPKLAVVVFWIGRNGNISTGNRVLFWLEMAKRTRLSGLG